MDWPRSLEDVVKSIRQGRKVSPADQQRWLNYLQRQVSLDLLPVVLTELGWTPDHLQRIKHYPRHYPFDFPVSWDNFRFQLTHSQFDPTNDLIRTLLNNAQNNPRFYQAHREEIDYVCRHLTPNSPPIVFDRPTQLADRLQEMLDRNQFDPSLETRQDTFIEIYDYLVAHQLVDVLLVLQCPTAFRRGLLVALEDHLIARQKATQDKYKLRLFSSLSPEKYIRKYLPVITPTTFPILRPEHYYEPHINMAQVWENHQVFPAKESLLVQSLFHFLEAIPIMIKKMGYQVTGLTLDQQIHLIIWYYLYGYPSHLRPKDQKYLAGLTDEELVDLLKPAHYTGPKCRPYLLYALTTGKLPPYQPYRPSRYAQLLTLPPHRVTKLAKHAGYKLIDETGHVMPWSPAFYLATQLPHVLEYFYFTPDFDVIALANLLQVEVNPQAKFTRELKQAYAIFSRSPDVKLPPKLSQLSRTRHLLEQQLACYLVGELITYYQLGGQLVQGKWYESVNRPYQRSRVYTLIELKMR